MSAVVPREPLVLRLGSREFKIRPLSLRQVEELETIVMNHAEATKNGSVSQIATASASIMVALSRDHAEVKADDIESDMIELSRAMLAIWTLGGFVRQGEAPAAADQSASTSGLSAAV